MHHDAPADLGPIGSRLGARLGCEPKEIVALLADSERAVLGGCRLVHLRADGVQWSPDDDRCMAGQLLVGHPNPSGSWSLEGVLFQVVPVG